MCVNPSLRSSGPETFHAHGDVDLQGAPRHRESAAGRDHQCHGPHLRGHPLIRKYYGITPDGTSLVGIYLWVNKAAADAFYTADWVAMVTKRWAGPPQRQEWETPMVVESAERRLVAAE